MQIKVGKLVMECWQLGAEKGAEKRDLEDQARPWEHCRAGC